ncbi:MAG TPA: adenine phosphoribosyltransferase [Nocardioidaceae bacterium]|nr:adenine phosphoribosyltransferase [Nocardioidaceae bacterium]
MGTGPTGRHDLDRLLGALIRDVEDFPKPGVVFKDITPLLAEPEALATVVDALAGHGRDRGGRSVVDKVVGIEARGFILAAPVALALGAGFVPVRKAGKLPGPTHEVSYALEYGEATLAVHRDALAAGDRVLVVDDVLATGGTVAATADLVRLCGASVQHVAVLLELAFLNGRDRLAGLDASALWTV